MDLDLYLGPPRPRRPSSFGLGSDLALGSPAEESPVADLVPPPFPHAPYSPSCASFADDPTDQPPPLSAVGNDDDRVLEYSFYSPSYHLLGPPYAPITPAAALAASPAGGHDSLYSASHARLHLPYDPPPHLLYTPSSHARVSMIPDDQDEAAYNTRRRTLLGSPDAASPMRGDGSSSRSSFLEPEFHLRRLIALHRRPWSGRPSRVSNPYEDEVPTSTMDSSHRMAHERSDLEASMEISRKNKGGDEDAAAEGSEEAEEERSKRAVNFECNICLELAKEPVVTPCGHLFCWPCLYQWLHLHCSYNECPVCKGEVMECDITPIYGRGGCGSRLEEEEGGDSGIKIPPRPHGRRLESWRQRMQRPISRRLFGVEIANSWRHLFGEEMNMGDMIDGDGGQSLHQIMGVESTAVMGRRSTSVGESMGHGFLSSGQYGNALLNLQNYGSTNSIFRGALDEVSGRLSSNSLDRGGSSAGTAVGPSRILARTDDGANLTGASVPLLSSQNHGAPVLIRPPTGSSQAVGQASASSTMVMIQEDTGIIDGAAGSSRHPRIRGRSIGSLHDDCSIHACKRRRS